MVELHSNFTVEGIQDRPSTASCRTEHQWHETIEITHGVTDWFEVGWYIFTARGAGPGHSGTGWAITSVRACALRRTWKWPVGASISFEFGYQRRSLFDRHLDAGDPAHSRQADRALVYGVQPDVRPVLSRAVACIRGWFSRRTSRSATTSPRKSTPGFEYYGVVGPLGSFFPVPEQEHQFFPGLRSESVAELGVQFRRRRGRDARARIT